MAWAGRGDRRVKIRIVYAHNKDFEILEDEEIRVIHTDEGILIHLETLNATLFLKWDQFNTYYFEHNGTAKDERLN